jgi:hypothetical protein
MFRYIRAGCGIRKNEDDEAIEGCGTRWNKVVLSGERPKNKLKRGIIKVM